MSRVSASVKVNASLAEVWDFYFEPARWPLWVDGFARVESTKGYPEVGGELRWASVPAGRGSVTERVLRREPRRLHVVSFEDPETAGELEVAFAIDGDGARVTQQQEYRLGRRGPLARVTDMLFIRSQMRGSLTRSLDRLKAEIEEVAAAATRAI